MKKLLLILIIITEIFVLSLKKEEYKEKYKYNINFYKVTDINKAKLENYVIGVVAAEMPATFSLEALKAQAVAARTFAYRKILDNNIGFDNLIEDKGQSYINDEAMRSKWKEKYDEYHDKISEAVLSTQGEVITYNDNVIKAYYFSLSNGKTEDSKTVFGEEDYLISVESSWDINSNGFNKKIVIPTPEFKEKLNINTDINLDSINRNKSGRIESLTINNKEYSGIKFRKLFNLRSTDFDIDIDSDYVEIITRGYGHGVGMSQYGANSMASEGKTYREILKYYYQNVDIDKI